MTINLKLPDLKELKPRILVFGVGGAGGNAVNNMIESGLEGVDFVVANTDSQALAASVAERRIQMGTALTEGLGAGSHPEIGRSAAEEAIDEIKEQLTGAHMAFITAGMGGGTGTGAAPVIARVARERGILTVGVVTKPFQFEGQRRLRTANTGIEEMQKHVDTLIVIPNQNLFRVANEKTTFADAFAMADQVLYSGVACITDLIVKEGLINLDFADVRSVMSEMGKAMMGTGESSGEKRAVEAAEAAISNPLLDDVSMRGAHGLLISITGGSDLTLYEVDEAASRIREEVDADANIILGATFDDSLEGVIRVSVVATGIDAVEVARPVSGMQGAAVVNLTSHFKPQVTPAPAPAAAEARTPETRTAEAQGEAASQMQETRTSDGVTLRPMTSYADHEPVREAAPVAEQAAPPEPYIPPLAERREPVRAPRMPRVEDFPIPGQNQLKARDGSETEQGLHAQKRKTGFFQKLANVGFGGRDHGEDRSEPQIGESPHARARAQAALPEAQAQDPYPQNRAVEQAPARGDAAPAPGDDDDHLEIPAFLRRQAN